ncbi:MAG TPA: CARDB domain-containing protein, partial [Candidatus Thermoplasmatota archaeon]|nr:CARDB domain-containing protein [Candidatus Thermoplasmatota archaeon]
MRPTRSCSVIPGVLALAALLLVASVGVPVAEAASPYKVTVSPSTVYVGESTRLLVWVWGTATGNPLAGKNVTILQGGNNLGSKVTDGEGRAAFLVFVGSDAPLRVLVEEQESAVLQPAVGLALNLDASEYEPKRLATASVAQRGSGAALAGVTLRLGSTVLGETYSDGTLVFAVPASPGKYVLTAEKEGYPSTSTALVVAPPPGAPQFTFSNLRVIDEKGREVRSAPVGSALSILADVANTGTATGEVSARLRINGNVLDTAAVHLAPGERTTVAFEREFPRAGAYTVGINDVPTRTLLVGGEPATPTPVAPTTPEPTPVFRYGPRPTSPISVTD